MGRAYNVIDADGHILEPLDLWDKYIDPAFRDRAPRIVKGENGKERLVIEEQVVGDGQRGIGRIGAVGARQGVVEADTMAYKDGKPGGFDPHKRIPDMDADGIDDVISATHGSAPFRVFAVRLVRGERRKTFLLANVVDDLQHPLVVWAVLHTEFRNQPGIVD